MRWTRLIIKSFRYDFFIKKYSASVTSSACMYAPGRSTSGVSSSVTRLAPYFLHKTPNLRSEKSPNLVTLLKSQFPCFEPVLPPPPSSLSSDVQRDKTKKRGPRGAKRIRGEGKGREVCHCSDQRPVSKNIKLKHCIER